MKNFFSQRNPFAVVMDHPRGSPPLTRGILQMVTSCCLLGSTRITPAYAGKTTSKPVNSLSAHGSPPLTRGIRKILIGLMARLRITPAYAGKIEHSGSLTLVALVRGYRRALIPNMEAVFLPCDRHKELSFCFYHQEHLRNGFLFCT